MMMQSPPIEKQSSRQVEDDKESRYELLTEMSVEYATYLHGMMIGKLEDESAESKHKTSSVKAIKMVASSTAQPDNKAAFFMDMKRSLISIKEGENKKYSDIFASQKDEFIYNKIEEDFGTIGISGYVFDFLCMSFHQNGFENINLFPQLLEEVLKIECKISAIFYTNDIFLKKIDDFTFHFIQNSYIKKMVYFEGADDKNIEFYEDSYPYNIISEWELKWNEEEISFNIKKYSIKKNKKIKQLKGVVGKKFEEVRKVVKSIAKSNKSISLLKENANKNKFNEKMFGELNCLYKSFFIESTKLTDKIIELILKNFKARDFYRIKGEIFKNSEKIFLDQFFENEGEINSNLVDIIFDYVEGGLEKALEINDLDLIKIIKFHKNLRTIYAKNCRNLFIFDVIVSRQKPELLCEHIRKMYKPNSYEDDYVHLALYQAPILTKEKDVKNNDYEKEYSKKIIKSEFLNRKILEFDLSKYETMCLRLKEVSLSDAKIELAVFHEECSRYIDELSDKINNASNILEHFLLVKEEEVPVEALKYFRKKYFNEFINKYLNAISIKEELQERVKKTEEIINKPVHVSWDKVENFNIINISNNNLKKLKKVTIVRDIISSIQDDNFEKNKLYNERENDVNKNLYEYNNQYYFEYDSKRKFFICYYKKLGKQELEFTKYIVAQCFFLGWLFLRFEICCTHEADIRFHHVIDRFYQDCQKILLERYLQSSLLDKENTVHFFSKVDKKKIDNEEKAKDFLIKNGLM